MHLQHQILRVLAQWRNEQNCNLQNEKNRNLGNDKNPNEQNFVRYET